MMYILKRQISLLIKIANPRIIKKMSLNLLKYYPSNSILMDRNTKNLSLNKKSLLLITLKLTSMITVSWSKIISKLKLSNNKVKLKLILKLIRIIL